MKTFNLKNIPLQVIVMAVFPIIGLYGENFGRVAFVNTIRSYVVFLSGALLCYVIAIRFLRNHHLAAMCVSFGLLLFYLIMPIQGFFIVHGVEFVRVRFLIPVFLLVFIAGARWLIKKVKKPEQTTGTLNLLALSTLILPLYQIGFYLVATFPANSDQKVPSAVFSLPELPGNRIPPDVYYIILDAHGRTDDILSDYGFDNTPALRELTDMGFYIAQCSNANYPDGTWQSMHAALNMQYFDNEQLKHQPAAKTLKDAFEKLKYNDVMAVFKRAGYEIVAFNTLYEFINLSNVDRYHDFAYFPNLGIKSLNRFETELLKEVPVGAFIEDHLSIERSHYHNVLKVLEKLSEIPQEGGAPKFVYAHIVVPHAPFVFTSTGDYLPDGHYDYFAREKYVDQVEFIDGQIAEISRQIIQNSSNSPIIIIQGDHGVPLEYLEAGGIGQKPGILNAYYFPDYKYKENLYPTISPVNTFRLIFNLYFDADLELLPDKVYRDYFGDIKKHIQTNTPYDFQEYTEKDECPVGR